MKKILIFIFASFALLSYAEEGQEKAIQSPIVETTETNGDWTIACSYERDQDDANKGYLRACQTLQIFVSEQQQPFFRIVISHPQFQQDEENIGISKEPSFVFQSPTGVLLLQGLSLKVDENEPVMLPFNLCDPQSCYAGGVMPEEVIAQMKAGSAAKLTFVMANQQAIELDLSLKGLTKTLSVLAKKAEDYHQLTDLPKGS